LGNGPIEQRLQTGIGVEGGARTFGYHHDGSAAWTGELGIGHTYHNSDDSAALAVGSQAFPLREFQLTSVRFGAGHEWYWQLGEPPFGSAFLGASTGGRLGSANARFLNGPQITDFAKGFYLGLDAGLVAPWHGRLLTVGVRAEWERDWFEIEQLDENLDRLNLLLSAGVRY